VAEALKAGVQLLVEDLGPSPSCPMPTPLDISCLAGVQNATIFYMAHKHVNNSFFLIYCNTKIELIS